MRHPSIKQATIQQQQDTLRIMRYNRFLLIRYACSFLFFVNLYLGLLYVVSHSYLFLVPLLLIFVQLPAIWEQIKLYHTPMYDLNFTKWFFILEIITLIGVCITSMTPVFNLAFPFLTATLLSNIIVQLGNLCLIGICLTMLIRLKKISRSEDKQSKRIQHYQQSL